MPEGAQAMLPQQGLAPMPASPTPASPAGGSAHCVPADAQQRRPAPPTGAQRRLLQQSPLAVQPVSPRSRQVIGRRQTFCVQVRPAQQSGDSAQPSPSAWQAQRPPSQSIAPQHSRLPAQVAPCGWQQRSATGVGRQSKALQQSAARAQVEPGAAQAAHRPPAQLSAPVQVLPAQQAWPDAPQVAEAAAQRPAWQRSVPVQALPAQQGWPIAPQVVEARQVPAAHSPPRSQVVPLQQGWATAPQATGRRQMPLAQARPSLQTEPGQQAVSTVPHARHMPEMQALPARQVSPAQQRWAGPPHSSARSQTPSRQTALLQHSAAFLQTPPTSTQQRPSLQP